MISYNMFDATELFTSECLAIVLILRLFYYSINGLKPKIEENIENVSEIHKMAHLFFFFFRWPLLKLTLAPVD